MGQPPVVDVTMGQNESQQIPAACESVYCRMNADLLRISVQRQSQIQQNPATIGSQFNTSPADFFRPTMNANAHNCPKSLIGTL